MPVRLVIGRVLMSLAVRASGAAGFGASAQGFIDDGLDGARAPAAFGATAKATIDLLGIARQIFGGCDGTADIVIGKDVAGTNNHEIGRPIGDAEPIRYLRLRPDAKGKTAVSSDSKLALSQSGMSLKKPWRSGTKRRSRCRPLIAAATTAITSSATAVTTSSSAIASTRVTGTAAVAGVAGSGMIAAGPMGMRMRTGIGMVATDAAEMIAAVAEITAAVRSRPVGRPPPIFC
jgi:hypothetical protein